MATQELKLTATHKQIIKALEADPEHNRLVGYYETRLEKTKSRKNSEGKIEYVTASIIKDHYFRNSTRENLIKAGLIIKDPIPDNNVYYKLPTEADKIIIAEQKAREDKEERLEELKNKLGELKLANETIPIKNKTENSDKVYYQVSIPNRNYDGPVSYSWENWRKFDTAEEAERCAGDCGRIIYKLTEVREKTETITNETIIKLSEKK